jgi:hypothetical protein
MQLYLLMQFDVNAAYLTKVMVDNSCDHSHYFCMGSMPFICEWDYAHRNIASYLVLNFHFVWSEHSFYVYCVYVRS